MERERNVVSSRERECENRRKRENGMTKTVITLDKDSLLRVRLCVCVCGGHARFSFHQLARDLYFIFICTRGHCN